KRLQDWSNEFTTHITPWRALGLGSIVAVAALTGFIANATYWIQPLGPIAYWVAALLAMYIATLIVNGFAKLRVSWHSAAAIDKWKSDVATINPLDKEFNRIRIKWSDLVHPITNRIKNKTFVDCELIGPANIGPMSSDFSDCHFYNCDVVVVYPGRNI